MGCAARRRAAVLSQAVVAMAIQRGAVKQESPSLKPFMEVNMSERGRPASTGLECVSVARKWSHLGSREGHTFNSVNEAKREVGG